VPSLFLPCRFSYKLLAMLSYQQARHLVISRLRGIFSEPPTESVVLANALGRILARDILADRDYPPFDRAIRDGYAVRATDTHPRAALQCVGELKAGDTPRVAVRPGTCIQIMTGAALPDGADAVIMVEHTQRNGNIIQLDRATKPAQHVVPRGSEQSANQTVLTKGTRFTFAEIAAAAQVGAAEVIIYRKRRIGILSTGDEVVEFTAMPGPFLARSRSATATPLLSPLRCKRFSRSQSHSARPKTPLTTYAGKSPPG
jgi:molybdopterin molybdotransferase